MTDTVDEARAALRDSLASWFSGALRDQDFTGFSDWQGLVDEALNGHPHGAAKVGIRPAIDALIAAVRAEARAAVEATVEKGYFHPMTDRALAAIDALRERSGE